MSDDLISRRLAIEALEREKTYCTAFRDGYTQVDVFEKYNMGLTDGIKALKQLPSAQPEILACDEGELNVPGTNVGDTISRQAAITTLCERRCGNKPKGCPSGFCTESLAVDCIPSAEPQRKKGKWIDEPVYKQTAGKTWDGYTYCSECGEMHEYGYRSSFCPGCGAEMEKGEEDDK